MAKKPGVRSWLAPQGRLRAERPFLRCDGTHLVVGEMTLPRRMNAGRSDLVPSDSEFGHFCIDESTARTLDHIARCIVLRDPCLLEGETATSKTSAIRFLAAHLRQPVLAVNLSSRTDTSDIVGRFVPAEGHRSGWEWMQGPLAAAMTDGHWFILDEVNLAEPGLLERLNSVVDRRPTMVVSEHRSEVIGSAERPVHPDFRIFATQNPAERYAGRNAFSAAWLDRWTGFRTVDAPSAGHCHEMLRTAIFGEQPAVTVLGQPYAAATSEAPPFPNLASVSAVVTALESLARFHAAAAAAGADGGPSSHRTGSRLVFTRRTLLSILENLAKLPPGTTDAAALRELRIAIDRCYVGRARTEAERKALLRLVEVHGLSPERAHDEGGLEECA